MTQLEDALRGVLRARADAADREPALLPGLERRISRARRRTLLSSVAAVTAVAVAVVVAVSLATASSPSPHSKRNAAASTPHHGVPLTDTRLTPRGWAPLPYLGAQISVPASWFIESSYASSCGPAKGVVFLGEKAPATTFRGTGCGRLPANVVQLLPARSARLGVQVSARGPLAGQVTGTLTRSPRSVVLARGPAYAVPRGWRWDEFGGIRFATPAAWAVRRFNSWGGCGFNVVAKTVWLNDATKLVEVPCPAPAMTAGGMAANPGIEVSTGRYGATGFASGRAGCRTTSGARICVLAVQNDDWGLLDVLVRVPGQRWPALIQIGLAGSGATARTIYDSIRGA
jgi:hypothetical protein